MKLEDLHPELVVRGVRVAEVVTVIGVTWHGADALTLLYRSASGAVAEEVLLRADEERLELVSQGRPWSFDGDGDLYRLVSEAHRIRLAHLFDPMLAVHTSLIDPLPHQITAVYEAMLPRQPLRFLLADDPGAGKTIMAGLLIKELIVRGDVTRCLIVCPGSLVEQWKDELDRRFDLNFEILTNDKLEAARTGNWFLENDFAIARLDKLARNEEVQAKLSARDCDYDLVICDEAHKMSATFFGGDVHYTKRYRLGQLLSNQTRHLLLMTATPHNGKETDFQLFLALLDSDRFEGRFRDGVHRNNATDLMRRMVKENLLKFDGRPLFPERIAYSVPYKLTDDESRLYRAVTEYVQEEFNRAEALQNDKRAGTVGFALTVLQRRLASSPEAIFQSLMRRRNRLEDRLDKLDVVGRGGVPPGIASSFTLDADYLEDLEDAPEDEVEAAEREVLDKATAASTIPELRREIASLKRLEEMAGAIRRAGSDTKWRELSRLLDAILIRQDIGPLLNKEGQPSNGDKHVVSNTSPKKKLVIFTEHRDTLNYLMSRIETLLGKAGTVVQIHGGVGQEQRRRVQETFLNDPEVQVLLATDAAGEGINLQRAHLMVNYDLPWNPNRLEQRFGRIHRIGQTEVCHLWNLVAEDTREGDVLNRLLEKLEQARTALSGQVFDVLGKLEFGGRSLRELLVEAIRYGDRPEVRARLEQVVSEAVNQERLLALMQERVLAQDVLGSSKVADVREELERAHARRLQPFYVESFFREAFRRLGGTSRKREHGRYQVSRVPATVRDRAREIGSRDPVSRSYERIAFKKELVTIPGKPPAAFVCPGHPLLSAVLDLTLERHGELLKRGAVLVDDGDHGETPRVLFTLEHAIQEGSRGSEDDARIISQRMLYVEMDSTGNRRHLQNAPHLDYRPLGKEDPRLPDILGLPELQWISREVEEDVRREAIAHIVPDHVAEVRKRRQEMIAKTREAVKDRLTKEISHWYRRSEELRAQESAGKPGARLNSGEAARRAEKLEERRQARLAQLDREEQFTKLPPRVLGGAIVIPGGLIARMVNSVPRTVAETQESAARARGIIMEVERGLGFAPTDREFERLGYDIESRVPETGRLRFIEVKGRVSGANTISVTRNEVMTALNKPDDYILAIVEFLDGNRHRVHYIREPFEQEPDWAVDSSNYRMDDLIARAQAPS